MSRRTFVSFIVCLEALLCCTLTQGKEQYIVPPSSLPPAPYGEWAHYHWVWLSNERANQASMMQYAEDYLAHGVKVGAVDIDSGWSTGFNNFVFDTVKYPNASKMVEFFHSKNIRIILWATSMVNTDSPNFKEAHDNGYLIKDVLGKQSIFSWWHGKGGLLDYTNSDAKEWWHKQMDKVLDLGIDGWKCDGTDPYILEDVVAHGKHGIVTRKEYSDAYYGDFFDYTKQKLGADKLIMSRPCDGFGPIFLRFSPKHVMYSGWVGDDDPTFEGLQSALKSYLQSAWAGYANFGSDIGGYRRGPGKLGRTKELFIRWAQLGAFSPLMENGGDKEHRPWKFDNNNETVNIYKKFVDAHYQLIPYLLTTGSSAMENQVSSITPLAPHQSFVDKLISDFNPPTYNYLLGKDILVAPIVTNDSSSVSVSFPQGHDWVYWWNHSMVFKGGSTTTFNFSLDEYPVFLGNGTIIPLRMTEQTVLPGQNAKSLDINSNTNFDGYLRWLLHSPAVTFTPVNSSARDENGGGITASYWWSSPDTLVMLISAHPNLRSLIHLAGLHNLPVMVHMQDSNESMIPMKLVDNHHDMQLEHGSEGTYYQDTSGGMHSLLIHPSNVGRLGHAVHVYF